MNVKYACVINGIEKLAITRVDTLSGFEKVKVCTAYEYKGKRIEEYPGNMHVFSKCKPIYEEFSGWWEVSGKKKFEELDENCKKYLNKISDYCKTPISIVSIGPGREETIFVK